MRCEDARCVPGCESNAGCAAIDPRLPICQRPGGPCVGLLDRRGECYSHTGYDHLAAAELTAEDLPLIGAFVPTLKSSTWLTLELAVSEINQSGGLPWEDTLRPLVVVVCSEEREAVAGAMSHLVGDLGIRSILASLEASAMRPALDQAARSGGAFLLSPHGYESSSVADPASYRAWHLGPDYGLTAAAYAPLLRRVVAAFAARGVEPSALRVASVVSDAVEDAGLWNAVAQTIAVGSDDFESLVRLGRGKVFDGFRGELEEIVAIANFTPHVVLVFAGGSFQVAPYPQRSSVIRRLEEVREGWEPTYILGPRNPGDPSLRRWAASSESFSRRAVGLRSDRERDAALHASLLTRFRGAFPRAEEEPGDLTVSAEVYDALYFLAYASIAASTEEILESTLLASRISPMERDEEPVVVGPADYRRAVELLRARVVFDLRGVGGGLSFDEGPVRARSGRVRAYCWNRAGDVIDVAHYDSRAESFSAVLDLPCADDLLIDEGE